MKPGLIMHNTKLFDLKGFSSDELMFVFFRFKINKINA